MALVEPLTVTIKVNIDGNAVIEDGHARLAYAVGAMVPGDILSVDEKRTLYMCRSSERLVEEHDAQYPHCDPRVLHAPGDCEYCDRYPRWQELRETWSISFTGKPETGKGLCPSDKSRGIGAAHKWHGNAPTTVSESEKYWEKMWSEVRAMSTQLGCSNPQCGISHADSCYLS